MTNIFISYSKNDKSHLLKLIQHLSPIIKSTNANIWHDEKLEAGPWDSEQIVKRLNNSEVIIFLTSANSLSTDYIIDNELEIAEKNSINGKCKIIPIILSACAWEETLLSKHTAKPEKGKPITNFSEAEQDEQWVKIVTFIKDTLMTHKSLTIAHSKPTTAFFELIKCSEPKFGEKGITALDIYVYPDLRDKTDRKAGHISAQTLLNSNSNTIIFGNTQSGKSLLAKKICIDAHNHGIYCIYIPGSDIVNKNPQAVLNKITLSQHGLDFDSIKKHSIKVIIDDPGASSLSKANQRNFYAALKEMHITTFLFYPENQKYHIEDIDLFEGYKLYDILDFNRKKREKLLKNWYQFEEPDCISDEELYITIDARLNELDTFLNKGIVPSRPFFILSILSQLENINAADLKMTSYGHCYQALITSQLIKSGVDGKDIDEYVNVLTELSYFFFKNSSKVNDIRYIDAQKLEYFTKYYIGEYYCNNLDKYLLVLQRSGIVGKYDDNYFFSYKYIFYFYVGKFLGEQDENSDELNDILDMMHDEECANILIFLNHHNKNPRLLKKIEDKVLNIFEGINPATLSMSELGFLSDFIQEIPDLVVEKVNNTENYRAQKNIEHETLEQNNITADKQASSQPRDSQIARINRSIKALDLIGQIIKNRHGSIKKGILKPLAQAAIESNLKFMSFFLDNAKIAQELITKSIAERFESCSSVNSEAIQKEARHIYLYLVYGAMFGIIRKFSLAVSSRESIGIAYDAARERGGDVGIVYEAFLHLSHEKIDIEKMKRIAKELTDNPIALRLIQEATINYMYMKDISFREKQQLTKIFDISNDNIKSLEWKKSNHSTKV